MTNEELAVAVQQGDADALEALWIQVQRYAYTIVKRYAPRPYADTEDYLQTAFLGVRAAALAFDPARGGFLPFAEWHIRRACGMFYRWYRKSEIEEISYNAPMDEEGNEFLDVFPDESLPDPWAELALEDVKRDVRAAVDALPEREQRIVRAHYFDSKTLEDIAAQDGVTPTRAMQIEQRALGRMRKTLSAYDRMPAPVNGVGVAAFRRHGASAVEHAALINIEREKRAAYERFEQGVLRNIAEGWYLPEDGEFLLAGYRKRHGLP